MLGQCWKGEMQGSRQQREPYIVNLPLSATPPCRPSPPNAAIAVRKDHLTLAQFLNGAMRELIADGAASPLLKIEAEVGG